MRIFLAGFMGTGKSTVGRLVAKEFKMKFIDMDEEIEKEEGMSIPQIFRLKGEKYFRRKEKEWVKKLIKEENIVVALGGGTIVDEENLELLKKSGFIILLKAEPQIIWERTRHFTHRPLLNVPNPLEKIKELLKFREPFYNKVSVQIDTSFKSVEQVTAEIKDKFYEYKRTSRIS